MMVTQAEVAIDGDCVGRIDTGLMVLMGIRPEDTEAKAQALVERLTTARICEKVSKPTFP